MTSRITRRTAIGLLGLGAVAAGGGEAAAAGVRDRPGASRDQRRAEAIAALEAKWSATVGFYAATDRDQIAYRADDRFPMLSTFKVLAAAAVLRDLPKSNLKKRLFWTEEDVVENSKVTADHVEDGLTVAEVCEAAITWSDNTAGNLLLGQIGGPDGLTRFARSIGDTRTTLTRLEPELNYGDPEGGNPDLTTPRAMAGAYDALVLRRALRSDDRAQLTRWMLANHTSGPRFGAALEEGWRLADKTGAAGWGCLNDVGVFYGPDGQRILVAAYTKGAGDLAGADKVGHNELLAELGELAIDELG